MTQAEQAKLHEALFVRLLREVKDGSLMDAQKALDMMQGETAGQVLEALLGDDRVSDGA